jgi:hypothetical protein
MSLPPLLVVHLTPMAARCMVGCFLSFLGWLGFHANLSTLNSTWPGPVGETYSVSPSGSGRRPFQDSTRHHPHNRQNRSHAQSRAPTLQSKKTALAAEPCCASDCNWASPWLWKSLRDFQGQTTTPKGWPPLKANPNGMKTLDSCTVRAQRPSKPVGASHRHRRART